MSLVGLVLSPIILFMAAPPGGLQPMTAEDLIFAAAFFGIASVIYEALFGRFFLAAQARPAKRRHPALVWTMRLLLAVAIWATVGVASLFALGLTFTQAMLVSALFVGIYVIAERKELLGNALASGACMAILILLCQLVFALTLYQLPLNALQLSLALAPVAWAGITGFAVGPLYEYVRRLRAHA